jgi:hypothetical protein
MITFKKPGIPSVSKRFLVSMISSSKEHDNPDRQVLIFRAIFLEIMGLSLAEVYWCRNRNKTS